MIIGFYGLVGVIDAIPKSSLAGRTFFEENLPAEDVPKTGLVNASSVA